MTSSTTSAPSTSTSSAIQIPSTSHVNTTNVEATASQVHAAASSAASSSSQPSFLADHGESALLQAHRAAFFFKLERELEKVSLKSSLSSESGVFLATDLEMSYLLLFLGLFRSMHSISRKKQRCEIGCGPSLISARQSRPVWQALCQENLLLSLRCTNLCGSLSGIWASFRYDG